MAPKLDVKSGPFWPKVALGITLLAFLLHLIAFGSDYWGQSNTQVSSRNEHFGLWKYCVATVNGPDRCDEFINITYSDWLKACQAFMTLAFFLMMVNVVVLGIYIIADSWQENMWTQGLCIAATGATTLCILISIGAFAGRYHIYFQARESNFPLHAIQLGWSYWVAASSLALILGATILMVMEVVQVNRNDKF